jgi:hypothetical protein
MMVKQGMTADSDDAPASTLRRRGGGTDASFILTVPLIVAVLAGMLDLGIGLQQWSAIVGGAQSATVHAVTGTAGASGLPATRSLPRHDPSTPHAPG